MVRVSRVLFLGVLWLGCTPAPVPFAAPRGTSMGTATEVKLGPAGGTLTLGALTITVPAGVFAQETTVTATPISATAPGARGQALRLGPEGTTFSAPVTLTFKYGDGELAGTAPEALLIAYQHSSGVWAVPADVTQDAASRTLSVKTTHFSDWSMVAGAQLRPPSARVKTKGTLALEARRCFGTRDTNPDPELASLLLGYSCEADAELSPLSVATSDWAVNGVAGGASTTGTVAGGGLGKATFTAPQTRPTPESVAVSTRIDFPPRGKALLVSNVTITDGARIRVQGSYQKTAQLLTAFVTATVTDSIEFEMPWPLTDAAYVVTNPPGGKAVSLADTRAGCIRPALNGEWDELLATRATLTGNYLTIEGDTVAPAITLGVGEGDCATMTRIEPAKTTTAGFQMGLPLEFFTSSNPPAMPVSNTQDGWTLTYTTLP